jgi:hypothetical protein
MLPGMLFADQGVGGWNWQGSQEEGFRFFKADTTYPRIEVECTEIAIPNWSPRWTWTILAAPQPQMIGGEDYVFDQTGQSLTCQFGNDKPQQVAFSTIGNEARADISPAALDHYSTITVMIDSVKHRFDLSGLSETIRMAGLKL